MAGLNKVMLIGRVGKNPDIIIFDGGIKKISFSLATTENYRDRTTKEWQESTEWHNIVGYGYLADKNIAKGDLIYVEGKIKNRKYKDKDDNNKYFNEILSEKINILARRGVEKQVNPNTSSQKEVKGGHIGDGKANSVELHKLDDGEDILPF